MNVRPETYADSRSGVKYISPTKHSQKPTRAGVLTLAVANLAHFCAIAGGYVPDGKERLEL